MRLTLKLITNIVIVTVIFVVLSTMFLWQRQKEIIIEQAHIQAKTLFEMILITRQWVAENRNDVRPVPAVVTKELSKYAGVMSRFRFHITSTSLINPENAPDEFEVRALTALAGGKAEYDETIEEGKNKIYRYMAPLYINEACLECHIYQGYTVGDLRGGISVSVPLDEIEASIDRNNRFFYMAGIVTFLGIVITISILVRRLVLTKLDILADAASSFKSGDYTRSVDIDTDDEIEELAEAFNLMRESILQNEDNLKRRLKDVTGKYVMLVNELEHKNDELRSVNSFKTEILDSISHEIRTPLTKILAYSELLLKPELENDVNLRYKSAETIRKSSKALNRLFNEIITLSRLEHKQHDYHFAPVKIASMFEETLAFFEQDIKEKKLRLSADIPENLVVCVDADVFKYLIDNLLSNAIKFNRQEGELSVRAFRKDGWAYFTVRDTGCGIPQHEIENVKKRFYRASNVKKDYPGTGLGLSIVNRVVHAHKGSLEIESELGEYTEFRVILPNSAALCG
ncbi:ATP-binding protein [Geovibrio ferrireducens]|uniref:ATP-binding protein n=1 Tax=Geovibrio ferrireducens TaxID=46201 RepID=UPI002245F2F5|nr:ATP-binding protein [Geovibrio ferrireducens]